MNTEYEAQAMAAVLSEHSGDYRAAAGHWRDAQQHAAGNTEYVEKRIDFCNNAARRKWGAQLRAPVISEVRA